MKHIATTGFSYGFIYRDSFVKKGITNGNTTLCMLDVIFEQQIYQAITHLENRINIYLKELVILKGDRVVDFYWRRSIFKDLTQINEDNQLAQALFVSVCYLADLHANKRLFHGDIKPNNLFVTTHDSFCTSDSGSLVPLTGSAKYISRVYTPQFASSNHI